MQTKKNTLNNIDKERQKVLRQFFNLDEPAIAHIKQSLTASRICTYCNSKGEAAKQDKAKKCLECHGTMQVPDVQRRNWAADEVVSRIAPKPKAVEMVVDEKRDLLEFTTDLQNKSDKEIKEIINDLGISFGTKTD